jgi:hypothetical protein
MADVAAGEPTASRSPEVSAASGAGPRASAHAVQGQNKSTRDVGKELKTRILAAVASFLHRLAHLSDRDN